MTNITNIELKSKIENMSFEQALLELEKIVSNMDSADNTLDTTVSNFEYGTLLKKHCQNLLNKSKTKIDKIIDEEN